MLELIVAVVLAVSAMAAYKGLKSGFDYLNELRVEAKVNVVLAPTWLKILLAVAVITFITAMVLVWTSQNWLVALAISLGTLILAESFKSLLMPRNDSAVYEKLFEESM